MEPGEYPYNYLMLWMDLLYDRRHGLQTTLLSFLTAEETAVALEAISFLQNCCCGMTDDEVPNLDALLSLVEKGYLDLKISKNWRRRLYFEYLPSRLLAYRLGPGMAEGYEEGL